MNTDRETGLPIEPMPEPFGVTWERFWKLRREQGHGWIRAFVLSVIDTRAVRP